MKPATDEVADFGLGLLVNVKCEYNVGYLNDCRQKPTRVADAFALAKD